MLNKISLETFLCNKTDKSGTAETYKNELVLLSQKLSYD